MFKKILLALVVVVGAFCAYVALQPPEFKVVRSAIMAAPQADVFEQVNDFHHWQQWSPWDKLDPNAKALFEGPASGAGAVFRWAGNAEVGEGSMTITESKPHERIRMKLDFVKPMESTADTEFTFLPEGDKTRMTWTMTGTNDFIGRAMCTVMNMDRMVGGQFEKGLENVRALVEKK